MALVHNPFVPTPDSNVQPEQRNEQDNKYFADMVAYTDKIVGRIVQNLDDLGLAQNTLVMFTTDNGTNRNITSRMGDLVIHGAKGKTTDAGNHVPFIASWKGCSSVPKPYFI